MVSMDTLILQMMTQAQKLVKADRASLFLVDNKNQQLYAREIFLFLSPRYWKLSFLEYSTSPRMFLKMRLEIPSRTTMKFGKIYKDHSGRSVRFVPWQISPQHGHSWPCSRHWADSQRG